MARPSCSVVVVVADYYKAQIEAKGKKRIQGELIERKDYGSGCGEVRVRCVAQRSAKKPSHVQYSTQGPTDGDRFGAVGRSEEHRGHLAYGSRSWEETETADAPYL